MILENTSLKNKINLQKLVTGMLLIPVIVPFLGAIIYAILYTLGLTGILSNGFTFANIHKVIADGEIFTSLLYSMYIATVATALAASIAFKIVTKYKASLQTNKASFLLYLPLALPAVVAAFLVFQVLGKSGFVARVFYQLHIITDIQQFPDVINDTFAIGIIITHACMALPFFIIYLSNIFITENIGSLVTVSQTLGATKKQVHKKILLPILWQKFLPTLLLYFIFVLGSYEIPLILGRQSPQMVSQLIVRKMQRYNLYDIPQGYCMILIYTILLLPVLWLLYKRTKLNTIT